MLNKSGIPKSTSLSSSAGTKPSTTLPTQGRTYTRPSASAFQKTTASSQSIKRHSASAPPLRPTLTSTTLKRTTLTTTSSTASKNGEKLRPAPSIFRAGTAATGVSRLTSHNNAGGVRIAKPAASRTRTLSTVSESREDNKAAKAPEAQPSAVSSERRRQVEAHLNALRVIDIVRQWQERRAEREHISKMEKMHDDLSLKLRETSTRLTIRCEQLERVNAQLQSSVAEGCEWRADFERRYADECAALTRRASDAQTALESARIENCRLADEIFIVRKEHRQHEQKLSDEMTSLQFVVDQKTEEIRKLRADNVRLQGEIDTLQKSKIEARKLRVRLEEANEQLNRQQHLQKELVQQLRLSQDEAINSINTSRMKEQENEVLKYKMQFEFTPLAGGNDSGDGQMADNVNSSWRSLTCSTPLTSRSLRSSVPHTPRRSHSMSGRRRPSIIDDGVVPNASTTRTPLRNKSNPVGMATPLHKSLDATSMSALSIFQTEGRRAARNAPLKIYTPDSTFEVHELSLLRDDYVNKDDKDSAENNNSHLFVDFDATVGSDM